MSGSPTQRVLAVIHGAVYGGAHNQLARLAPGLRAEGFEPIAALPPEASGAAARLAGEGVETYALPLSSFRAGLDPRGFLGTAARLREEVGRLRRAIRERDVSLVQVHGVINPHGALAARREGVAITWQLLDTRAPMALRRAVMPYVVRRADSITTWGRALAEAHPGAASLGDRLVTVFPPLDPTLRPDPARRDAARERLGVEGDGLVIGTLGVRNSQKGHQHFVRAAAIVAAEHPDTVFRVIGSPSPGHAAHMAAVEREAEALGLTEGDRLRFVDPGEDARALLQALDVFVLTSVPNSEGMPTAILEAMACALPVVATDVGAIGELVTDGRTGAIVRPEDPEAIASAVGALTADPEQARALGAAGRERAEREFPLDRLVELHVRAYRTALTHRAGR